LKELLSGVELMANVDLEPQLLCDYAPNTRVRTRLDRLRVRALNKQATNHGVVVLIKPDALILNVLAERRAVAMWVEAVSRIAQALLNRSDHATLSKQSGVHLALTHMEALRLQSR
jgi:hypothetical protein